MFARILSGTTGHSGAQWKAKSTVIQTELQRIRLSSNMIGDNENRQYLIKTNFFLINYLLKSGVCRGN